MHLIDTKRSVPYSVKQLQELLGITCAFEQAIQRLLASVTMVAKGMLKEHLILLANSMTSSGNLVGFNVSGIKALSRSLNVQVPFTEATLFTPKKCFELAAEKCHVDSLASTVASCSWGKHVAVGTSSSFDILFGTGEAEQNETDVYDFLNLVHSSLGVEKNSACLDPEIDDLDWTYDEDARSPEHASEKPVFEDGADIVITDQNIRDRGTQSQSEALGVWGRSAAGDSGVNTQWSARFFQEEKAERYSEKVEEVVMASFPDETAQPEKNTQPDRVSGLYFSSGRTKEDQGTSYAGDRSHKRNHPFNNASSESIPTAMTVFGRRLDMFTTDEQELLMEIEPIVQSVRKILNQPGYNDGDPLATDDQGFIIENVFNFHPNKVVKMGAGIDYVMIDKHSIFQNTRCFHIVRTDGHKEDFSYIKCLQNYMEEKFPDRAEAFIGKYFRRRNQLPYPGWRESNTPETGTYSKSSNLSESADSAVKRNRRGWKSWTNDPSSVPEAETTEKKGRSWGE